MLNAALRAHRVPRPQWLICEGPECGVQRVFGPSRERLEVDEARYVAAAEGWTVAVRVDGKPIDLCPTCSKALASNALAV